MWTVAKFGLVTGYFRFQELSTAEVLSPCRYKSSSSERKSAPEETQPSLQEMNIIDKMCSSSALLLLAAVACLSHEAHAEDPGNPQASDKVSRPALLRSRRMVGGTLAPNIPWQAMVQLSDNVGIASGALISDRWVLTAGLNVKGQDVFPKVYLGISNKSDANQSNQFAVERVVLHPGFQNKSYWDNNLALIQLKKPVVMTDKITPIPLPQRGQDLAGVLTGSGVIAGWGWGVLYTPATSLKYLVLSLSKQSECQAQYQKMFYVPVIDDSVFCTEPKLHKNVCPGDAGGALAVTDAETGDIYAAGILSFDRACKHHRRSIYMKVSYYLPWIHSVIRGDTEESSALRHNAMSAMFAPQR